MAYKTLIAASFLCVAASSAYAGSAGPHDHPHCWETGYSVVSETITVDTSSGFGYFKWDLTLPDTDDLSETCWYEVSDITSMTITLSNFPSQFAGDDWSLTVDGEQLHEEGVYVFSFQDGVDRPIEYASFANRHPIGNQHFDVKGNVTVVLYDGPNAAQVSGTNAIVTISGKHYFIPEPSTALLLGFGLMGLILAARRRHS